MFEVREEWPHCAKLRATVISIVTLYKHVDQKSITHPMIAE